MTISNDNPELENLNPKKLPDPPSNMEKDPEDWVTGDESITGAQASYLKTLCEEAKVDYPADLTKAEASKLIDQLRELTGRGTAA